MGSFLRSLLLCVLALLLPAALAVFVSPLIFSNSSSPLSSETDAVLHPIVDRSEKKAQETEAAKLSLLDGDPLSSYVSVSNDPALDPREDEIFLLAILLKVEDLPKAGKREKVIYKYDSSTPPYAGWALALHRMSTSLRPEVYWRDDAGKGGWFSFDEFNLVKGAWHRFYLFAQAGEFLSLYVERLDKSSVYSTNIKDGKKKLSETIFLGGFEISDVSLPNNSGDLFLRATNGRSRSFRTEISEVIIANVLKVPSSSKKVTKLLSKGTKKVVEYIGLEQIELWLDRSGQDLSSRKRLVTSRGKRGSRS